MAAAVSISVICVFILLLKILKEKFLYYCASFIIVSLMTAMIAGIIPAFGNSFLPAIIILILPFYLVRRIKKYKKNKIDKEIRDLRRKQEAEKMYREQQRRDKEKTEKERLEAEMKVERNRIEMEIRREKEKIETEIKLEKERIELEIANRKAKIREEENRLQAEKEMEIQRERIKLEAMKKVERERELRFSILKEQLQAGKITQNEYNIIKDGWNKKMGGII